MVYKIVYEFVRAGDGALVTVAPKHVFKDAWTAEAHIHKIAAKKGHRFMVGFLQALDYEGEVITSTYVFPEDKVEGA